MNVMSSPQARPLARPPLEHWQVGEPAADAKPFDFAADKPTTTADLLQRADTVPAEGTYATYRYRRDCSYLQAPTPVQYLKGAALGAAAGAAMIGVPLLGVAALGDVLSHFTSQVSGSNGPLLACVGLFAAGGAAVGAFNEYAAHDSYPHKGEQLPGKLVSEFDSQGARTLAFYPMSNLSDKVNLADFAQAPTVPGGEPNGMEDHPKVDYWWQRGWKSHD